MGVQLGQDPPEEFLDTHYRLGQVIAAEAKVTGSNEASKAFDKDSWHEEDMTMQLWRKGAYGPK